jgi:hypothetical protein
VRRFAAPRSQKKMHNLATTPAPAPRIETVIEGERLIAVIGELLDTLRLVVEEETELVRNHHIAQATRLAARKQELAGHYYAATERLKANAGFLKANLPEALEALQHRHDSFRPLLQTNLTVLATAHAVSEGIIRGVAGELTRKAAPQTYGVSGRTTAPAPSAARPVTLSRTL